MGMVFGGGGLFGGGGGGGVSGSGVAGRVALWSSASGLTSDAGLTYSGTGTGTVLRIGSTDTGLSRTTSWSSGGTPGIAFGNGTAANETTWIAASGAFIRGDGAGTSYMSVGSAGTSYLTVKTDGTVQSMLGLRAGGDGVFSFSSSSSDPSTPDALLTRRAAATLQLGAADSATPVPQTLAFQGSRGGTDTNVAGADATIQGSLGTGTGGGGNILIRTAPRGSTGTTQNTATDRLVLAAKQVTLTESSATPILDVAVASGTVAGGEVLYTIRADDATDFQALTGRVQWSAVNKGGTLTATLALVGTETVAVSSGTLTNTPTITTGANLITINLNAVSSLTQTTLYAYVQAQNNGTGVVTTK